MKIRTDLSTSPSRHSFGKEGTKCRQIFCNKCCIVCLIIIVLLSSFMIAAKIYIDMVLDEVEVQSLNATLTGQGLTFHKSVEPQHFLDTSEPPEDIAKELTASLSGFDYADRPVWIIPFGKWDIKGLLNSKEENEKLMHIFGDQRMRSLLQSLSLRNSSGYALICDMEGYSYSQFASLKTIKFLLQLTKKYKHLLKSMDYGFTINLDYFSETFISLTKPIFGSEVMGRMEMSGSDRDKYVEAILRKIPASQLPPEYGGSKGYKPVAVFPPLTQKMGDGLNEGI